MKARELKEWVERAPPDAVISLPAKAIAEALSDLEDPKPNGNGSSSSPPGQWIPAAVYARQVLGSARSARTVARWCKEGKIGHALPAAAER